MEGVRCMVMRGGTSKGAYFLPADLPSDTAERDDLLMRILGTPDDRQIDGIGGAHPLTSKVAIVSESAAEEVDVEYLFLQVGVGDAEVTDRQNCGNLLAGVGPFALERGLVTPEDGVAEMSVRIKMLNTDSIAVATFGVSNGQPVYDGDTTISGVPGTAAPIRLVFEDIAGASTGGLFPTGFMADEIAGVRVTLVDNGMPVVVLLAQDMGISGYETCQELEANEDLKSRLEEIRVQAGKLMNLGDVTNTTIPKMTMVAPPQGEGHVCTRSFIPHRCHQAIGVLAAVSAATGCVVPGTVGHEVLSRDEDEEVVILEHPTGTFEVIQRVAMNNGALTIGSSGILRTARKLMDGLVYPRPRL